MKMKWYMMHTSYWLLLLLLICFQAATEADANSTLISSTMPTSESTNGTTLTTTKTTSTTTILTTTTRRPVIEESCTNNESCSDVNNTVCMNGTCQCRDGFFKVNSTTCSPVSDLEPKEVFFIVGKTYVTLKWKPYSEPVMDLIKNDSLKIVIKMGELLKENCSVNISKSPNCANCTGLNLTSGEMYTLTFSIEVKTGISIVNISINSSSAPAQPGIINTTYEFHAPNITLEWEASLGLVDNYTVIVTEENGSKNKTIPSSNNSTRTEVYGLLPGRNHTVVIVANRFDKTSDPRIDYFSTVVIPPEPPINVTALPNSISQNSLNLTWTRQDFNGPPLRYEVCIKEMIYRDQEDWNDTGCYNTLKNGVIVEWFEVSKLTAGAFYWFTVYSYNSNYNSTPANSSVIQTKESYPDVVTPITFVPFDDRTEVHFDRPQRPYGNIVAYSINARNVNNHSDCHVLWLQEKDYQAKVPENWKNCSLYPQINISINQRKMDVNITKLQPDSNYSIEVTACTMVGCGTPVNHTINTNETVPGSVSDVTGVPINSTEIFVQWRPPVIRPGKTVYHVEVHDIILGNITQNKTVDDYTTQNLTVDQLRAHWIYQFAVYATTSKGSSSSVYSGNVTTPEATPGAASDLHVIHHNGSFCNARVVNFTWKEPKLEERNGKIVQYMITVMKDAEIKSYTENITNPEPYSKESKTWSIDLETLPQQEYHVQVWAITATKKEGHNATMAFSSITCKPPPYNVSDELISSPEIGTSSVTVHLYLGFFRNDVQGNITVYGLVVSDSNTANINLEDIPQAENGKANGFPYKFVLSDLQKDIQSGVDYAKYSVKNLREDTTFYLSMYACTTAGCTRSNYYGPYRTNKSDSHTVAIVVSIVVVLLVISLVAFILYRKGYHTRILASLRKSSNPENSVDFNHISIANDNIIRKRPFKPSNLEEYLEEMNKDSRLGFAKEYEDIQKLSPIHSTEAAVLGENKSKNRWVNILAFDHSRVKLQQLDEDDPTSDYINANFIPDLKHQRAYIATQGPLPGTMDDFWRMVWEHKVTVIVMLTKCKEGNRVKCEMYWPNELHEAKQYGDIIVSPVSISNMDKFDINVFDVTMNEEIRRVMHFHFQEFPDFSADVDFLTFVNFVKTVRQHIPHKMHGPIVVHCSAGVGRTGTYITVDCLHQLINSPGFDFNEEVDIFDYVLTMRDNRTLMVQVEQQYIMIHECLRILLEQRKQMEEGVEENLYENQAFALTRLTTRMEEDEGSNRSPTSSLTCPLIVSDNAPARHTTQIKEDEGSDCSTTSYLTCPIIVSNNDPDTDEEADKLYENASSFPRTEL